MTPKQAKIPYNSGYGDFCFGRLTTWQREHDPEVCNAVLTDRQLLAGTHYVCVAELDGFERQGYFPFFKLPPEARDFVYGELLRPLGEEGNQIRFELESWSGPYHDRYEEDFHSGKLDREKEIKEMVPYFDPVSDSDSEFEEDVGNNDEREVEQFIPALPEEEDEKTFNKVKRAYIHAKKPHPERKLYNLTTFIPKDVPGVEDFCQDWLMIRFVRHLSQLNCQFRQELGAALWRNSVIICRSPPSLLTTFLKDRPAIHKSIKALSIKIVLNRRPPSASEKKKFQALIDALSVLELDVLQLCLLVDAQYMEELIRVEKNQYVLALRSIKVTKQFDLKLTLENEGAEFGGKEFAVTAEWYKRKWISETREALMPDSMGHSVTDEEEYLQSRQELLEQIELENAKPADDDDNFNEGRILDDYMI